jgi:excisionase family DNA binding protein
MMSGVAEAPHNRLLNFQDAAAYMGVRSQTIRRLIERGALTPVKLPLVRRVLFDRLDLDRLIDSGKSAGKAMDETMPLAAVGADDHGQG